MRRNNPDFHAHELPGDETKARLGIVTFKVKERVFEHQAYTLLNTPSIFQEILASRDPERMEAVLESITETAMSRKAFHVVFLPLIYGYLDLEEINANTNIRQAPLALLVDSLRLAGKIKAPSIIRLIQQELDTHHTPASLSLKAIQKLYEGRPATDDFLTKYVFGFNDDQNKTDAQLKKHMDTIKASLKYVESFADFIEARLPDHDASFIIPELSSFLAEERDRSVTRAQQKLIFEAEKPTTSEDATAPEKPVTVSKKKLEVPSFTMTTRSQRKAKEVGSETGVKKDGVVKSKARQAAKTAVTSGRKSRRVKKAGK